MCFAFGVLTRFLPEEKVEPVKGMALTADGNGAVFDVAAGDLDFFLAGQENAADVSITVLKSLPDSLRFYQKLILFSVIPAIKSVAEVLLKTSGLSAVDLLAKALAKAAG